MIKITERGWPGHFILASQCLFRRNTLIESDQDKVIVSTVGNLMVDDVLTPIGIFNRYFETAVFGTEDTGTYIDANVYDAREFDSNWQICANDIDDLPHDTDEQANIMHDAVVKEMIEKLKAGEANKTSADGG